MRAMPSTITGSPGTKALVDDPVVADLVAHLHRLGHRLVVGHHVDELALRPFEHRARGHQHCLGLGGTGQAHTHELARLQRAIGVGHLGLGLHRAGVARHPRVREQQLALARVHAAVGELDLDRERFVRRQLQLARGRPRCATSSDRCRRCRSAPSPGRSASAWSTARAGPETSVPSETCERPAAPDSGASTLVYSRFSAASARRACAALRSARATCSADAASSYFALAHGARIPQRLQARQRARAPAQAWPRPMPRRHRRD